MHYKRAVFIMLAALFVLVLALPASALTEPPQFSVEAEDSPAVHDEVGPILALTAAAVVAELLMLLLFGYRALRTYIIVAVTNIVTQGLCACYFILWCGHQIGVALSAVILFVIEAIIYRFTFREHSRRRAWGYSAAANALGMAIVIVMVCFYALYIVFDL